MNLINICRCDEYAPLPPCCLLLSMINIVIPYYTFLLIATASVAAVHLGPAIAAVVASECAAEKTNCGSRDVPGSDLPEIVGLENVIGVLFRNAPEPTATVIGLFPVFVVDPGNIGNVSVGQCCCCTGFPAPFSILSEETKVSPRFGIALLTTGL